MAAGRLDRRLHFERRVDVEDGYGNIVGEEWINQFTQAANIKFLRGGESVMASRLEAKGPVIVIIRNSTQAREITGDWRAVDARNSRVYAVKELPRESDSRGYLEMLAESGVPA